MESVRIEGEWISPQEAAVYLGVSTQTIRAWCRSGELRHSKLGHRTVRISVASIERMMERRRGERISWSPLP